MENNHLSKFKPFNKSIVKYLGMAHIIEYREVNAIYPYSHIAQSCYLNPQDKDSHYYQDFKRQLGDDWSTDMDSIPVADYISICEQLGVIE